MEPPIALTRPFKDTVCARLESDPAFKYRLLVETAKYLQENEGDTCEEILSGYLGGSAETT